MTEAETELRTLEAEFEALRTRYEGRAVPKGKRLRVLKLSEKINQLRLMVRLPETSRSSDPIRNAALVDLARKAGDEAWKRWSGGRECMDGMEYIAKAILATILAALPASPGEPVACPSLDERQKVVVDWGKLAFGAEHMADKIVRAARFFEEAAEFAQAVGLPRDHAQRAFDHVYSRPAGDPAQEAGGSANTLMAACDALGLSLDKCQQDEIARCLAKDPAHFRARNIAKITEVDAAPKNEEP